jgi:hypothetical protein
LWFASNLTGKLTICPACGMVMRLAPPAGATAAEPPPNQAVVGAPNESQPSPQGAEPLPSDPPPIPVQTEEPEHAPQAVEDASLTHQAAAAVGEIHIEAEESDLVQWEQPSAPAGAAAPAPPPATPPEWSPAPLSSFPPPAQSSSSDGMWVGPPQVSRIDSLMANVPVRTPEEEEHLRRTIVWGAGAIGVVALIVGVLWMLSGGQVASNWETAHRDEILTLKQDAEQLALAGNNRQAYDKYQELERLVSGQTINDPFLKGELDRSWLRRDALFDLITHSASKENTAQTPATEPAPTAPATPPPAPEIAQPPATEPSADLTIPQPATQPVVVAAPPKTPLIAPPPPVQAIPVQPEGITDAQIGASINQGVDFLLAQFKGAELNGNYEHYEGLDTLAVYALMQAELATHDKRLEIHGSFMIDAIAAVKKYPMTSDYVTYARALRSTALALNDRPQDHWQIMQDVDWLLHSQEQGAFTYNNEFPRGSDFSFWDNSNSQYGLLGVWSGAEVGVQVPLQFWRDVRTHWSKYQFSDGEWGYRADQGNSPSRSMTLAGIASLFVAQDYLDPEDYGDQVGRPPFTPSLDRALQWLESGDNSVIALPPGADFYTYYALYGLERTGLASGFKYYGSHDWYRERAADIVASQAPSGSWGGAQGFDAIVNTSYSLLFLARGRHPVLMNKLRYDGDWANRPRDVANLARFASSELERPLNWQVVPIDHDWVDWTDSPILYMAGDKPPNLADADRQKIRQYIENGGMLLTQADAGREGFSQFAEDLGKQLFPQYPWIDLPDDSVLYSVSYHITDHPKIRVITNGSRILMMHWPTDITHYWQLRQDRIGRSSFELGANLALYAAGKSELKNRLETDDITMPPGNPAATIALARVQYDGNWNPEPAAWPRARRWFRQQTNLDIDPQPTSINHLGDSTAPIAHLIGTGKLNLTDAEIASVKKYVEHGGVLVIEPCGLPDAFLQSVHDDLLLRMFPTANADPVPDTSPLLTASSNGMLDVSHPDVRQFVRSYTDITDARPLMLAAGDGHIIILPVDMTSGLLGADAWGIAGYQSEYALKLMKNLVLWTWNGAKD